MTLLRVSWGGQLDNDLQHSLWWGLDKVKTQLIPWDLDTFGSGTLHKCLWYQSTARVGLRWDLPDQQSVMLGQITTRSRRAKAGTHLFLRLFWKTPEEWCVKREQSVAETWTDQQQWVFPENPTNVAPFRAGGTFLGQQGCSLALGATSRDKTLFPQERKPQPWTHLKYSSI